MEHPFAQYVQTLGKGKRGAKDLTLQEAEQAMTMILSNQVEPVQLGAFLMLMRVKEETSSEIAGFVRAARASLTPPKNFPQVDLDWSSYAGKRRQLPWLVLSALLLASHGTRVLMHGITGGSADRIFIPDALHALGIEESNSLEHASSNISSMNFAFVPLRILSPDLDHMLNLKSLLGLRSPVHTLVRMLNPISAPASIIGIFHPGYDDTHQQAAMQLGDNSLAVFKGEGGEAERNPDSPCKVKIVQAGAMSEEEWPAMFSSRHVKDADMDISRLVKLWRGETGDEYGTASVLGTTAIALRALGRAHSIAEAEAQAAQLWDTRNHKYFDRNKG